MTVEDTDLALGPAAQSFLDPHVESEFRAWQRARTRGVNRAARVSALGGLALGAVCSLLLHVPGTLAWVAVFTLLAASSLGSRALATSANFRRHGSAASALVNLLWGGVLVTMDVLQLHAIELSVAVAITCAFFGFTLTRTRPRHAMLAAGTYLTLDGVFVVRAIATGTLSALIGAADLVLLLAALVAGTRAARGLDAQERRTFRHERLIERQRETIARQRALLEREVSHQVAERSRELGAALAKSDATLDVQALVIGEHFADRYRIVAPLGAGGMGAVYEVERITDGARLALKAVVGAVSGASAARFAREAEIGARVQHANLVSIVDVGIARGVPFLVMDLVRGGSLEAQRAKFGDVEWALPILRQIAEGVAALHDAGVVHRDLKPANVLLADGVARISDFGISRFGALDESSIDPLAPTQASSPRPRSMDLTGTGVVMGTPLYMAPEGARSARMLDASADVFALGIIAYEMLTGRAPFEIPPFLLALAEQSVPAPPQIDDARVPAALRNIVTDCFATDPRSRPRVRAVLSALEVLGG